MGIASLTAADSSTAHAAPKAWCVWASLAVWLVFKTSSFYHSCTNQAKGFTYRDNDVLGPFCLLAAKMFPQVWYCCCTRLVCSKNVSLHTDAFELEGGEAALARATAGVP